MQKKLSCKKRYVHWLKISHKASDASEQYLEIDSYLKRYPNAKATIYLYDYSPFDRTIRLECSQNWNDLDLRANSGFHNLKHLEQKPKNISILGSFTLPGFSQKAL